MDNTLTLSDREYTVSRTTYADNNSLAILLFDEYGEYDVFSINLSGYGFTPEKDMFVVDHNMVQDEELVRAFVDKFCDESRCRNIAFGPFQCKSYLLALKDLEQIPSVG